jgi:hypothetical protein
VKVHPKMWAFANVVLRRVHRIKVPAVIVTIFQPGFATKTLSAARFQMRRLESVVLLPLMLL